MGGNGDDSVIVCVVAWEGMAMDLVSRSLSPQSYCSAKCQREHWRDHAAECKNAKRASISSISSMGASPMKASPSKGSHPEPSAFESPGKLGHPQGVPLPAIEEDGE